MIGAAIDVAGAVDRLERRFDLLADAVDRVQIGAEDFDADVGAHAGREHFDAVDDGLGEDVAPAGHLQHAAHLVVDQVALGAGLRGQRKTCSLNGFSSSSRNAIERREIACVELLVRVRAWTACGKASRLRRRVGASASSDCALVAALASSSRAYQVISLGAAVEQLPVDLVDALAPVAAAARASMSLEQLRRRTSACSAAEALRSPTSSDWASGRLLQFQCC